MKIVCASPSPSDPAPSPGVAPPKTREEQPDEFQEAARIIRWSKTAVTRMFSEARMGKAVDVAAVTPLVDEISASVSRNASALISLARLKSRDEYTYMHSVAVCALMINLARQMELDEAVVRDLGVAGLLHDVGKMAMPEAVLNKPGKLTDEEFTIMKSHAERGHEMLLPLVTLPQAALEVCLHHHERMDGKGYPHGLAGEEISLFARMGAVCDVYDAITSNRPYKTAWSPAEAMAQMFRWTGHFDDAVLKAFIRSIGIYPVGSLVRLASDQLAVVTAQHHDLTRPLVRTFFSASRRSRISVQDIDLAGPAGDRILSREDPDAWGFRDWEAYWPKLIG